MHSMNDPLRLLGTIQNIEGKSFDSYEIHTAKIEINTVNSVGNPNSIISISLKRSPRDLGSYEIKLFNDK